MYMKKVAVIVAGGSGQRMGTALPKQFLLLKGKPVLWYSVRAFMDAYDDITIILVLPKEHLEQGEEMVQELNTRKNIQFVSGGSTRFHSVQNGLVQIKEPAVVFVHDAVRCLVTPELIRNCYETARTKGSAIPVVAATDSIRIIENGSSRVADRNNIRIIQTPQTFLSEVLLPAFQANYLDSFTDEATVVEAAGNPVTLVEGEYSNIKITRPIDLVMAEKILQERASSF
jgi:2-C-methyl-D-erythritol 4-phosphate cytidylyltransferase